MIVAVTRAELHDALGDAPRALVPTLGALHAGHGRLIDEARRQADKVVVSVFVNPLQFGAGEDLERYPRTLDADVALSAEHGADVVFAPAVDVVYPGGPPRVTVDPGPLADILEGASRPGHFRGVLTVVAKLFGLVQPQAAMFGEKDYQQLALIRQLVTDLSMPVQIVEVETVRDDDGLALSSRNRYLSADERVCALALSGALRAAAEAGPQGADAALAAAQAVLDAADGVDVDYLSLRSPDLADPPRQGAARLLVAARVGSTRLIDNAAVQLG